uniref:Uncharacterized protein n=1 Tax=Anguilla anguilla TaxID=7936 RepID=A0A0E9PTR6_ANGAN
MCSTIRIYVAFKVQIRQKYDYSCSCRKNSHTYEPHEFRRQHFYLKSKHKLSIDSFIIS